MSSIHNLLSCPLVRKFFMETSMLCILGFLSLLLLFTLAQSHSINATILSKCHEKERSALLKFKATFYDASCDYGYGNLTTWSMEGENGDCCKWDGIECDEYSGHGIGLLLWSSCLSGSINSSSSIFELVHLQRLNLSDNDFHYSKIPSAIGNLSRLTSLELSGSNFSGQIPLEILHLTNLSWLGLSANPLSLVNPNFTDLTQTLTKLEVLNLDYVNIPSVIPDSISTLSGLQCLTLSGCGLQGEIPSSIANLASLRCLFLTRNNLVGDITSFFFNLTQLQLLDLSYNELTGEIFPQLLSCTKLSRVDLSFNNFFGQIPSTLSHLKNLSELYIRSNNFSGKIYLDVFFKLEHVTSLDLSFNNFSLVVEPTIKSHQRLISIGFASCNLKGFPKFLEDQDSLEYIDLSSNNIFSEVPKWFLDVSVKELFYLNLSYNHLTGFEGDLPFLKWEMLETLDLRFNKLKGFLPSLSTTSCLYYLVSNNNFSGEVPTKLCILVNLKVLDLGDNNLSGKIPPCLTNLVSSGNLSLLRLQSNNFNGRIPQIGKDKCNLVMIDMSSNQLEGPIPRNIKNCISLQFLNLGNNMIDDVFPFWLGELPTLSVLILESNRFHGTIEKPKSEYHFPKLRIISLSRNKFIGRLPSQYFIGWSAMKVDAKEEGQVHYFGLFTGMDIDRYGMYTYFAIPRNYFYSFRMDIKGVLLEYKKIQESLMVIDLSSNNFIGEIPESIGTLKGLTSLNLSNNMLNGSIPFNLSDLTNLESMDLSHNNLSGEIPQQLTYLTTLSYFDVSFNQLTGLIPLSKQFNTFEDESYQGNPGLCGLPLSRKCESIIEASPPLSLEKDHTSKTWIEFNWAIVSMGYATGLVIGVTMGMKWTRGCKKVKSVRQVRFILN